MTRSAKIWSVAAVVAMAWAALATALPGWLGLSGTPRWILTGVLAAVGLFGAIFTAVFLTKRPPAPPAPKDPLSQEVEAALTQAERRLLDSKLVKARPLQRLPVIFVMGERQQHKTSTVLRSGSQAELLAGDVLRGVQVTPTEAINIWLSRPALLVEAGQDVLQDAERRARLFHRLQPARLADAVTRGEQAPRAAVICHSCEQLGAPGAAAASGRALRQTLGELAQLYGVRLPVYVVFTGADTVPGFKEYAKSLSSEEVKEILGVTLPLTQEVQASGYADAARVRIRDAFTTIVRSLSERRHLLLARTGDDKDRAPSYQFPKELRRLEGALAEFLIELVRPSELQVNPLLRGFYFTGVREILVSGDAVAVPEPQAAAFDPGGGGATALLRPLAKPASASAGPPLPGQGTMRRQPQWVFLERFFSAVVLDDPVAFRLTRGGTRVSYFRRMALGTGLAAVLLLLGGITVSFARNFSLIGEFTQRKQAAAALPAETVLQPTAQQLALLDSLGDVLDRVSDQAHGGLSPSYRWGLSRAASIYPAVRTEYFKRFGTLMYAATRDRMTSQLRNTPPGPLGGREYEATYRRLKTHLIGTTPFHDSSTVALVAPTMLADWPPVAGVDTALRSVALRQFERYARELQFADLYAQKADDDGLRVARLTLNRSSGVEPIFNAMMTEASSRVPELRLSRMQTISVPGAIPGAFTARGWDAVHASLKDIKRFLVRELWVLGPDAKAPDITEGALVDSLRARYDGEFAEQWRNLVRTTSVIGFRNLAEANTRLTMLASPSSELLQLMAVVNENIPDDSLRVARSFTTVAALGQPKMGPSLGTEATKPYMEALAGLASKVGFAASVVDKVQGKPQYADAQSAAGLVTQQVQAMGRPLDRTEWENLGLGRLFEQPARYAASLLGSAIREADEGGEAEKGEADGKQFCQDVGPALGSFPFAASRDQVSPQEVVALVSRVPQVVRASPEANAFIYKLQQVRSALGLSGSESQIRFEIGPDGSEQRRIISVTTGGRRETWQPGESEMRPVVWRPAVDQTFSIGISGGNETSYDGAWAPLRFFRDVEGWGPDAGGYRFRTEQGLAFRVRMSGPVRALLHGEAFEGLRCPAKWTRPS